MIELVEGLWVNTEQVTLVKAISKDKCSLYVKGQGATDGFVLDYSAEEVVDLLHDAIYGVDEDEEEEEDA